MGHREPDEGVAPGRSGLKHQKAYKGGHSHSTQKYKIARKPDAKSKSAQVEKKKSTTPTKDGPAREKYPVKQAQGLLGGRRQSLGPVSEYGR